MITPPPPIASKVLRALLDPRDQDIISSDLVEEYSDQVIHRGLRAARGWYRRQVWGFLVSASWLRCSLVTASGWFGAFLVAAAVSVNLPSYTPVPAVVVFLLAIPGVSFYVANRTNNFRAGLAATVCSCGAMVCVAALFIAVFQLRHPPAGGLLIRLSAGVLLAAVCAFAGKASREGLDLMPLR